MDHVTGTEPIEPPRPTMSSYHPSTRAMHADDHLSKTADVAPAMHVSTTFRYSSNPDELIPMSDDDVRGQMKPEHTHNPAG